jgi:hypothetical protein
MLKQYNCSDKPDSEAGVYQFPKNGLAGDKSRAASQLHVGRVYTVKALTATASSSSVELEEVPGMQFNTVHLSKIG